MLIALLECVVIGAAAGTAAVTIAKTHAFKSFRHAVAKNSFTLGRLVRCSYCLSHWLSLLALYFVQPRVVETSFWLATALIDWFFIVGIAAVTAGAVFRMYSGIPTETEEDDLDYVRAVFRLCSPEMKAELDRLLHAKTDTEKTDP